MTVLRRALRSPATASAIVVAAAVATGAAVVCAIILDVQLGWPPRILSRIAVVPGLDSPWGAPWDARAGAPVTFERDALAALVRATAALGASSLAVAALSLALHSVSRTLAQWRALATRCALGARLRDLMTLVGTELIALGAVGCGLGMLGGIAIAGALRASWPDLLTRPAQLVPAITATLAAAAGVALLLAMVALALLLPLQRSVRVVSDLHGEHVTAGGTLLSVQRALATLQLAVLLVVTYGGALMLRSSGQFEEPGTSPYPDATVVAPLRWSGTASAEPSARSAASARLLEATVRGGRPAAALTSPDAWLALGKSLPVVSVCGACMVAYGLRPMSFATVRVVAVSPGALGLLSIRLRRGRDVAASDTLGGPRVAVINETAAAALFPGGDPIGKRMLTSFLPGGDYTVVGIARTPVPGGLGASGGADGLLMMYVALLQHPPVVAEVTTRAGDSSAAALRPAPAIRQSRADVGPFEPLAERLDESRAPLRWFAALFLGLAGAATAVAAYALAAVMHQMVALRQREIAIRLALGAHPRHVVRWLFGKALGTTVAGIAIGVSGARWLGFYLHQHLTLSAESDLYLLGQLIVAFGGLALLATALPARRAARVQPAALWSEPGA
jgi:hypothetical protein